MKRIKYRPVLLFFLIFTLFFLSGFMLLPRLNISGIHLPGEAVFVCAEPMSSRPSLLFSALPLPLSEPAPEATSSPTPAQVPKPTEVPSSPAVYAPEPATDGDGLLIKNSTDYSVDPSALLSAPISLGEGQPKVLIVHTHTSEAYTQSEDYPYTPSDSYRTEDPAYNICRVGQALAESLETNGISALHDTTSHDYPSYSGCYGRSLETMKQNLALHPDIDVIIDLHRDALADPSGGYLKTEAEINGKKIAQALVVIGTDAGGLEHPNWQKNLSLGLKVQQTLCTLYPGLARPLHLRTERFNGHAAEGALLIEIGSNGNTMEEALETASLVGHALAETLKQLCP